MSLSNICLFCKYFDKVIINKNDNICYRCGHYLTCDSCTVNCEYRNDLYNVDGDCLMEK